MTARKAILLLGLAAFTASVLLPPWCAVSSRARVDQGYDFLFSPPMRSSQIDFSRLLLEWAGIGGLSMLGAILLTASRVPTRPSAEGKMPLPRESTPIPEVTSQANQQSTLTQEQIDGLSKTVSEAIKSRFVAERHSQAERIVQACVITEAKKHLRASGGLETFPTDKVVQREVSRYASEYLADEEVAGAPPLIGAQPVLPQKWLTFWTHIRLPGGILLGLGALLLHAATDNLISVALQVCVMALIATVAIGLHNRRLWGWRLFWIVLVLDSLSLPLLSTSRLAPAQTNEELCGRLLGWLFIAGLWFVPNFFYFKKRRCLFR